MNKKVFKFKYGILNTPVFFPDATRAVVKSLDSEDIVSTSTRGILVNTFHLWQGLERDLLSKFHDIRNFMNWKGAVISDSGGFQVMSLIKSGKVKGKITDEGVVFYPSKSRRMVLSPEDSIDFQIGLGSDMVVVLDDFTDPNSSQREAKDSVERTIDWAKRSKIQFEKRMRSGGINPDNRPYILGVVQGGPYQKLREYCAKELAKIGFDGFGYGGWPMNGKGEFDYDSARTIADNTPDGYFLYGLGIGKPEDIVGCTKLGYNIFDCVLPTRDARHERLYVFNANSIDKIDLNSDKFYSYYDPRRAENRRSNNPVSNVCDCLLCKKYSRAYLAHLFTIGDFTAGRLSTIHNLRFYSMLMDKIGENT